LLPRSFVYGVIEDTSWSSFSVKSPWKQRLSWIEAGVGQERMSSTWVHFHASGRDDIAWKDQVVIRISSSWRIGMRFSKNKRLFV
jgi:plasmid maintenance system killer protein